MSAGIPEAIARHLHEEYEERAPDFGWETQAESRKPWALVPERNRNLMIDVVGRLLERGVITPGPNAISDAPEPANSVGPGKATVVALRHFCDRCGTELYEAERTHGSTGLACPVHGWERQIVSKEAA
jgi:hypothetical protein